MDPLVQALLVVPWTVSQEPGEGDYLVLRIRELPEFVVAAPKAEIDALYWDALESLMESYVEAGDLPPVSPRIRQHLERIQAKETPASGNPVILESARPTGRTGATEWLQEAPAEAACTG